jgi:hypothetical protein
MRADGRVDGRRVGVVDGIPHEREHRGRQAHEGVVLQAHAALPTAPRVLRGDEQDRADHEPEAHDAQAEQERAAVHPPDHHGETEQRHDHPGDREREEPVEDARGGAAPHERRMRFHRRDAATSTAPMSSTAGSRQTSQPLRRRTGQPMSIGEP